MPQTKPDERLERHVVVMVCLVPVLVLGGPFLGGIAIGAITVCVGLYGIAWSIWVFRYYRCPGCHRRLRPDPRVATEPLKIRYHCQQCDTIWDSGITWGNE